MKAIIIIVNTSSAISNVLKTNYNMALTAHKDS